SLPTAPKSQRDPGLPALGSLGWWKLLAQGHWRFCFCFCRRFSPSACGCSGC
ncbi:hypothetical protein LTS18_003340, partial [Coniosporium uncinatum]